MCYKVLIGSRIFSKKFRIFPKYFFQLFLSKQLKINKCTHKCRLYKYQDSFVLFIPTVHGSVLLTHTLLVQTNIHDVSAPWIGHGFQQYQKDVEIIYRKQFLSTLIPPPPSRISNISYSTFSYSNISSR